MWLATVLVAHKIKVMLLMYCLLYLSLLLLNNTEKSTSYLQYNTKSNNWIHKIITAWRETKQYTPYLHQISCGWRVIWNYSLGIFTPLWNWIINQDTIWKGYELRQKTRHKFIHAQQLSAHMDKMLAMKFHYYQFVGLGKGFPIHC